AMLRLVALVVCLGVVDLHAGEPQGKLYETHAEKGRPTVEIYMHGFLDSSFDAYLVENGGRELLFASLPCMKAEFGNSTNAMAHGKAAKRIGAETFSVPMYSVYWSTMGKRMAIAWQGYFVAAYDTTSKQRLMIPNNPVPPGIYKPIDALFARFLAGEEIATNDIVAVRKQAWKEIRGADKPKL
ncbi:MAG: hypothetical protein ACXWDN_06305, partial [Limisphaerales bacterium]